MSQTYPIYLQEIKGVVLLGGTTRVLWAHWFEDKSPKSMICFERPNNMGLSTQKCKHCADPHFADLSGIHERAYVSVFVPPESDLPIKGSVILGIPVEVLDEIPAQDRRGLVISIRDEGARIELMPAVENEVE